ncbi:MAG: PHP-associated domain-containing protein [archaeon]
MKIDLHNHSLHSFDCNSSIKDIKNEALKQRITFFAITDHDVLKIKDSFFITGCEFSTELGHVIGLFLKKEIKSRKAVEVMTQIRAQDGIVYIPHPLRKGSGLSEKDIIKFAGYIDAIEVFNPDNTPYGNRTAYNLAKKLNKCMLTGSDAHTIEAIGKGASESHSIIRDKMQLKKLIKQNHLKINYEPKYSIMEKTLLLGEMFLRKTRLYELSIVRKISKPIYKVVKTKVMGRSYR